jgi:AraC-like DNA-binding protein
LRFLAQLERHLQRARRVHRVNRVLRLLHTPSLLVERFDHAPGVSHRDPECEQARSHAVSFVEAGSFRLRVAGGGWREIGAKHVFVATPGLEFSCGHDEDHPRDRCLSVRPSGQAVESLRGQGGAVAGAGVRGLDNRSAYLRLRLEAASGAGDAASAEALAGDLLLALGGPRGIPPRPLFRAHQLSSYAARVGRVRALIDVHFAEPLSLSRMAAEAGMSLYHFARVFRQLEGRPAHSVLRDRRLVEAEVRLRGGASVTETCYAVGFGSLSHFVTAFRRHRGLRPSDARKGHRGLPTESCEAVASNPR